LAPERSYLWAIAPGKPIQSFRLPPDQSICKTVDEYAKAIRDRADSSATGRSLGRKLYDTLIEPARQFLPPGSSVVLVPDGCLNHLNLETLLSPENRYWVEEAAIEIAPSLRLFGPTRASAA